MAPALPDRARTTLGAVKCATVESAPLLGDISWETSFAFGHRPGSARSVMSARPTVASSRMRQRASGDTLLRL